MKAIPKNVLYYVALYGIITFIVIVCFNVLMGNYPKNKPLKINEMATLIIQKKESNTKPEYKWKYWLLDKKQIDWTIETNNNYEIGDTIYVPK
jgi:hypothetical protein